MLFILSFGFDSKLDTRLHLRANYVFQRGTGQFRSRNINAPLNGVRPDNEFGNIIQVESSGFFVPQFPEYRFERSRPEGSGFWIKLHPGQKDIGFDGVFGLPSDNFNLRLDRSPANDDQRHRINSSISWKIRKGLLVTAIHNLRSPLPFNVTTGSDRNNDTNI